MKRFYSAAFLIFFTVLTIIGSPRAYAEEQGDVIARVGDQVITFSQIDTMINSSSIVGLDIPALGTPERNKARLALLDKVISADLLYLDALKQGMDKNPVYQADVKRFADSMLPTLYREKVIVGDLPVSDKEIKDYYNMRTDKSQELNDQTKTQIESVLRMAKFKKKIAGLREKVRKGIKVTVHEEALDPKGDEGRKSDTVVAMIGKDPVLWGDIRNQVTASDQKKKSLKNRLDTLNKYIDNQIMIKKAKEAGLEKDPIFQARLKEFKKVRLVNLQRSSLLEEMTPTEKEIREYYKKNKDKIGVNEVRKIQMVVLKTKKEAEKVKKMIESGKITIYEAARDYSIDPNAKKTLGEMGWVSKGTGFPALDKLTFSLDVNELGGPVESPVGWHLVKVLDARDAMYQDINDKATWKKTRRMLMHEKMDNYVAGLRKNEFPVVVYQDVINRIMQAEVDRMAAKKKAAAEGAAETEKKGEKK
jgi:peptidyl-prolyl cis-trans isomerase C